MFFVSKGLCFHIPFGIAYSTFHFLVHFAEVAARRILPLLISLYSTSMYKCCQITIRNIRWAKPVLMFRMFTTNGTRIQEFLVGMFGIITAYRCWASVQKVNERNNCGLSPYKLTGGGVKLFLVMQITWRVVLVLCDSFSSSSHLNNTLPMTRVKPNFKFLSTAYSLKLWIKF